jgi:glycosyltransferase involved in cell wall biosynthesis
MTDKKQIIIRTNHPAPYIDKWIDILETEYNVDVFYDFRKSNEKSWQEYNNTRGFDNSQFSLWQKFRLYRQSDLVILGGWNKLENIILCILLYSLRTKVAIFLDHPIIGKTKTGLFARFFKKSIIYLIDFLFPACQSCKNYLHSVYGIKKVKMIVFPYAHSIPHPNFRTINTERKKELLNSDKINLLIVNRFIERKGYDIVFNALQKLKDQDLLHNYQIKIAGNGELFSTYKKKIKRVDENIEIMGWIEYNQYETLMNHCDVFLHASLFEPFGIPPIDAMQRGKNVIVSDGVKSISDLLFTSQKIQIYPANDSMALYGCLNKIIIDKEHLYDNYEELIETIDEFYSLQRNLDAIKSVIE